MNDVHAWMVRAAARQLRDADLIERYGEEWLAGLIPIGDKYWRRRYAVSLLTRGARATRRSHRTTLETGAAGQVATWVQRSLSLTCVIGVVLIEITISSGGGCWSTGPAGVGDDGAWIGPGYWGGAGSHMTGSVPAGF